MAPCHIEGKGEALRVSGVAGKSLGKTLNKKGDCDQGVGVVTLLVDVVTQLLDRSLHQTFIQKGS